ncbi:MAG: DNA mismatch repair endonuclease MutL [Peptococcaceae bacterium]|nr:DNA mismatch repair endonuclease MutL [Peptococcaceae bacterium]MDH7524137.1 DNA mismatch repair endonuclease MutL [Peptococcaceae bacterium]
MASIHLLDESTANQIAAGEVIERPFSVVKELVENAIDAGASTITVEIRQGGLSYIRVTDDGCGMSEEDALLSVKRHATSKIKSLDDLNALQTLGFRGEALPSINAVARLEILTCAAGQTQGTKMKLEGNKLLDVEPAGAPKGTSVTVRDLFFNTPARKKFMRNESYEGGLIHELVSQFSLGHPAVNFRLIRDDKEVLNTKGVNNIPELIELYYGPEARGALVSVEKELPPHGKVRAFLTGAGYSRANRKAVFIFVNSRRVISRELLAAVEEAYENMLPGGRFPLAVMHLDLHPSLIDVNVHPSKLEIRLREPAIVANLIAVLKEGLREVKEVPQYIPGFVLSNDVGEEQAPYRQVSTALRPSQDRQESFRDFFSWDSGKLEEKQSAPAREEVFQVPEDARRESPAAGRGAGRLPELRIIGQLAGTFILAEGEEGLYLIDQHAAHERIIYDRMVKQAEAGPMESQVLLEPVPVQLTPLEEETVIEMILPLADLGIILEHFGTCHYLLRAVPAIVKSVPEDFFRSLIQHFSERHKKPNPVDVRKEFIILASCKGAVKAGQKLSVEEMQRLIDDLNSTACPLVCPHGRPVINLISHKEILKAFRR